MKLLDSPTFSRLTVDPETLRTTLAAYTASVDEVDEEGFLAYLVEQGVISEAAYVAAVVERPMQITAMSTQERERVRLLGSIGSGGMATVRVARDEVLERDVAVKVLRERRRGEGNALKRFLQEARIMGNLDHANIPAVHGLTENDNEVSFSMKLVDGVDLAVRLDQAREQGEADFPLRERLEVFVKACDAVEFAHEKGVIHRDLKPTNIMTGRFGEVYVMDWGIAKILGQADIPIDTSPGATDLDELPVMKTADGTVLGTPAYMPPEQALAGEVDERGDVYALGAVLFELVTLRRMIPGGTSTEVLFNVLGGARQRPEHLLDGVTIEPTLVAIVERATAAEAGQRYRSVAEMAEDVRRFLADEETTALPDEGVRKALRWIGRHRARALTLFLIVTAVLTAAAAFSFWRQASTLRASQERERRSNKLVSHTAERAHAIDAQFIRHESAVRSLATAATEILEGRNTEQMEPHVAADFDSTPPQTSFESPVYHKRIAVDRPGYKLSQGEDGEEQQARARALGALAPTFQRALREAGDAPPDVDLQTYIGTKGSPIRWAYVGTTDGIMVSYPAKGGYPPEYDPRKRPWYELGVNVSEPAWGNAYVDVQGQGMVLPVVVAITGREGTRHGVAGIETTFDRVIQEFMTPREPVTDSYLIDERARVVVRSADLGKAREQGQLHSAAALKKFEIPEVVRMIEAKQSGLVSAKHNGKNALFSFQRISTIGWYYVERSLP